MCTAKDWLQSPPTYSDGRQRSSKRSKIRVRFLIVRKRYEGTNKEDMELKNLKLYIQNRSILEENEKLRQKAMLLRQENKALFSEFQKKINSSQLELEHHIDH
ncbi:hypothetical protein BVRB_5g101730 [Beta vulgaris subsp. vulgaris]|nr:hypothetical protein BVRB_5g101730 [Beta vulgaris subsp. vulgaris]